MINHTVQRFCLYIKSFELIYTPKIEVKYAKPIFRRYCFLL